MLLTEDTILERRYRIDGLIAKHDNGATYRAFDDEFKAPVAIKEKLLHQSYDANQFMQEALILTGLNHPALPKVTDHFSVEGRQYLVMDFIVGESLWERISTSKHPFSEYEALTYITTICQIVSYLHGHNPPVIHQDIKPHNIRLLPDGQLKLVDFGVARSRDSNPSILTNAFTAPEIRISYSSKSPASDIFSLGATLYTLITGDIPPPITRTHNFTLSHTNLSPEIARTIAHTMRYKVEERPQSVAILQSTWDKLKESASTSVPVTVVSLPIEEELTLPPPPTTGPLYWLVDPTGLGYPLGSETLTIGSAPENNIQLDNPGIAPHHASIRIDEQENCVIRDQGSKNGTMLNDHRLGTGWYPLNPGDNLVLASTRFHLTTTEPVKIGSTTPKPKSKPASETIATTPVPDLPTPDKPKRPMGLYLGALLTLLLISGGGMVLYSLFAGGDVASPSQPENVVIGNNSPTTVPAENTAEAIGLVTVAELTAVPVVAAASPSPLPPTSTATSTPPQPPTATTIPLPTATTLLQDTIMVDPTNTLTPTATLAPTKTPTVLNKTPTPTGPTVIPLDAEAIITNIGDKEVTDVDVNLQNPREVYTLVKGEGLYKSNTGGEGPWLKMPVDASSVVSFVIDPTNPARFYASTWNAVLKSTDGGNSWEANTNGLLGNQTVDVVAIDPVEPDTLYAGVGEDLVASTDGGQTWSSAQHGTGLGVAKFYDIVIDPFDHNIVYVAGLAGSIYKSTDGARTFTQLPDNIGQGAFSMIPHPHQENVFLVGINSAEAAILKTEDGIGFTSISTGLVFGGADSPYSALVFAPSNANIIYAGTGDEDNRLGKGIFKSTNGGQNWVQITNNLPHHPETHQPFYVKALAVDPTNPDIVFAATGGGLFRSTTGGESWQQQ